MTLMDWGDIRREGGHLLSVELLNGKPVDLIDLTTSLATLARDFQEYSNENSQDPIPGNLKYLFGRCGQAALLLT